jgi:rod shape-determining protein MreD
MPAHLISWLNIDIVIIGIVYLLAWFSESSAGIFALGQGLLMDIFSGNIWGINTAIYLVILLFIKIVSRPFDLMSPFGQIPVIFISICVRELLTVSFVCMFASGFDFSFSNYSGFFLSAVFSALITPFIFYILNTLGRFFCGVTEDF